jgi:ATP-dependent Lhr-like helicase
VFQLFLVPFQSETTIPYIDAKTQAVLDEYRSNLRPLITEVQSSIQLETDRALWWTFAGGQINHTLKYGLQFRHDWKITSDNFKLKIEGDSVGYATLSLAMAQMSTPTFWEAPATQRFILSQLPEYRLSKFQRALPEVYSLEMISNYLLDIRGVINFLKQTSDHS